MCDFHCVQATLRHPDSSTARENRDTVFCQMRRAMDLIHFVVKDGVLNSAMEASPPCHKEELDVDRGTFNSCMRNLQHLLELSRVTLGTRAKSNKVPMTSFCGSTCCHRTMRISRIRLKVISLSKAPLEIYSYKFQVVAALGWRNNGFVGEQRDRNQLRSPRRN